MKIGMFSPYVPKHFGGGEKYFFDVARVLSEQGHEVLVGIPEATVDADTIRQSYESFLNVSLKSVQFVSTPLWTEASFGQKLSWTKQFDVMYYLTDGSLFFSQAKKNILHIQFPFTHAKNSLMERLKLWNWSVKNTNSFFTKGIIEKNWHTRIGYVHHPMVAQVAGATEFINKKDKVILHVGRFFRQLHSKRQDVMVKIFRKMFEQYPGVLRGWKLVLIGSVEDESYAKEVADLVGAAPIEIHHHVNRQELETWYKRANIYWHATGFGVDPEKDPEKVEHFGISTCEAMSYGAVPIVINKGGQPEVVGAELSQLLWQTEDECISKTIQIIENETQRQQLAAQAIQRVTEFSEEKFIQTLNEMIK
jgi:glycosyltransferase involved in cell wall biosynthesis